MLAKVDATQKYGLNMGQEDVNPFAETIMRPKVLLMLCNYKSSWQALDDCRGNCRGHCRGSTWLQSCSLQGCHSGKVIVATPQDAHIQAAGATPRSICRALQVADIHTLMLVLGFICNCTQTVLKPVWQGLQRKDSAPGCTPELNALCRWYKQQKTSLEPADCTKQVMPHYTLML